jgi:hypothetical protein
MVKKKIQKKGYKSIVFFLLEAIGTNSGFEVVNEKIIIHSQGCNQ